MSDHKLQLIPLGGLGEFGMNSMAIRYGDDIIVVDAGMMFPDAELLGVDIVTPDFAYLEQHRNMVRALDPDAWSRGSHRRRALPVERDQRADLQRALHAGDGGAAPGRARDARRCQASQGEARLADRTWPLHHRVHPRHPLHRQLHGSGHHHAAGRDHSHRRFQSGPHAHRQRARSICTPSPITASAACCC